MTGNWKFLIAHCFVLSINTDSNRLISKMMESYSSIKGLWHKDSFSTTFSSHWMMFCISLRSQFHLGGYCHRRDSKPVENKTQMVSGIFYIPRRSRIQSREDTNIFETTKTVCRTKGVNLLTAKINSHCIMNIEPNPCLEVSIPCLSYTDYQMQWSVWKMWHIPLF